MKVSTSFRRLIISLILLFSLSVIGVVGFYAIDDHSVIEAVYMTIITMSTVGFGTVKDLSPNGMLFASFLIIGSVGTFLYTITNLTTFVVEGEIRHVFHHFKVNNKVAKLKDHIIICGLGRNGRETALELIRQRQPFVVVEMNEDVIEEFLELHDGVLFVQGDATHEDILEKANIATAKGLISSLSTDAENVYVTLTAREMNPRIKIVARASHESTISKLKRAGANEVIAPNLIGGRKMANLITRPALIEFVEMVSGEHSTHFHLEVFTCGLHDKLAGKTIAELQVRSRTGATIIGLKSGNQSIQLIPPPNQILDGDDRLFVLGHDEQLDRFREVYLG